MFQVLKYDKNFKMLMKLGEALKPGSDNKHFCKPTDVAVASNGHFFVADGYCNSRVMKFDEHGKLLAKFGSSNGGYHFGNYGKKMEKPGYVIWKISKYWKHRLHGTLNL